jgi:hypothetical protein
MKFKSGVLLGFGAGYVLGAKAGKERYQQIVEAFRAFQENPGVQRLTEQINQTVAQGKERVSEVAGRKVEKVSSNLADQAAKAKEFVGGGKTEPATGPKPVPTGSSTAGAPPSTSGSPATSRSGSKSS